jgi:phosphoadenosine phosphosulfate reductase
MATEWNLNLINCMPQMTVTEQESQFGILYQSEPNRCCGIRKVEPLKRHLSGYTTWFTGLRREQSPTRANLQPVSQQDHLTKVSPLYDWTMRDVEAYCVTRGIPRLSLYDQGYTSIGCQPCTILPVDPSNARSGRWAGSDKLECGLHVKE